MTPRPHACRSAIDSLLPLHAHTLAQGRLYVSLTRVWGGENLLLSNFHSRDELIKVSQGGRACTQWDCTRVRGMITHVPAWGRVSVCRAWSHLRDVVKCDHTGQGLGIGVVGPAYGGAAHLSVCEGRGHACVSA